MTSISPSSSSAPVSGPACDAGFLDASPLAPELLALLRREARPGSRRTWRSLRCASETGSRGAASGPADFERSRSSGRGNRTCSDDACSERASARAASTSAARGRRPSRQDPRAGGRSEGHRRDESRIVAKPGAVVGLRPGEVEDEFAPGMRLQVERERTRERPSARAPGRGAHPSPCAAVAQPVDLERKQELVTQERAPPHRAAHSTPPHRPRRASG